MAAPLAAEQPSTGRVRYVDKWTHSGAAAIVIPLVLWGAASVCMLAKACGIPWYVAWIPAVSTSGVMLVNTRLAMRRVMDPHVKRWATYLAAFAVLMEIIVAGLQHSLPDTLQPPAAVMFIIGALPTLMGAATIKIWSAAVEAQEAADAAAQQATFDAQRAADAAAVQLQTERQILAEREASATRQRNADIETQRQLTRLAQDQATAEQQTADARARVTAAVRNEPTPRTPKPAKASPKKTLHAVDVDALGRVAKPSPKRDAALRYLIEQARAGRLDEVTAVEVDKHIGGNAYARRYLPAWKKDVRAHLREVA